MDLHHAGERWPRELFRWPSPAALKQARACFWFSRTRHVRYKATGIAKAQGKIFLFPSEADGSASAESDWERNFRL